MEEKEITERIQYFQSIATRYGHESVPASEIYHIFDKIAQPAKHSFSAVKSGLYGKAINDDIVHLLKLQALKGASHTVWWGVSLSYVPHAWQAGLRWHRTFRSSRFDLFETPFDHFSVSSANWREGEKYLAHSLNGERFLRETLESMWKRIRQLALAWFSSMQSLDDVLQKSHEQAEREWTGPQHYPDPMMVYAFTLGRMGRTTDAHASLNDYFVLGLESSQTQDNLKRALAQSSER
jgi:hypothetical protein